MMRRAIVSKSMMKDLIRRIMSHIFTSIKSFMEKTLSLAASVGGKCEPKSIIYGHTNAALFGLRSLQI